MIPIFFRVETKIETLETNMNNEFSAISLWLEVNKPSLNSKRSHHIFRKRKNSFNLKLLSIYGEPIDEVDKTKFPGILIDNKLRKKQHIAYVSGKISRGIGLLRHVSI